MEEIENSDSFELDFAPPMNIANNRGNKKSMCVGKNKRNNDTIDWVEELTGEKYARVKRGQSGY